MAHGVPVLVTESVGCHINVDASGGGLTVADNPAALAQGMRQLLAADRDRIGQCGRSYVQEHLSWSAVIDQMDAVYHDAWTRNQTCRKGD